ncbi:MAG: DNA polymerase III subunit gamma/tau [Pseudomonadota bacterium]|nr:DNA polymerase III subunit gamma/tau [Pseudomonadota bacterium]
MAETNTEKKEEYRVLARKYRPQNFDDLRGQDVLVRTLKNAIESGRIAHAFMLTGVRGVGKTTTARIIAKALNYTGADGKAGPTTGATDDCDICRAIAEDRHPDVIEMDAASNTGVENIREILDSVRYAPSSARYKIYIIDEVHMLSKSAFNALLKTLEEPPEHVKFIFATTEIRKVPVTVLSRCQRFDLRRIEPDTLIELFTDICKKEAAEIEDEALMMIARAADGSARDGLSILDQAISMAEGKVTADQVKSMLGLADQSHILDLFDAAVRGKTETALDILDDLYNAGAEPMVVMQDLLDISHILTRLNTAKDSTNLKGRFPESELKRAAELAQDLSLPALAKSWQILLAGHQDVMQAPRPQAALEMVIIRLVYAANLPDPDKLLKQLEEFKNSGAAMGAGHFGGAMPTHPTQMSAQKKTENSGGSGRVTSHVQGVTRAATKAQTANEPMAVANANLNSLEDIVALLEQNKKMILASQIYHNVHLISLKGRRLEIALEEDVSQKLAGDITTELRRITGHRDWVISIGDLSKGQKTLAQIATERVEARLQDVMAQPFVAKILELFPGTEIRDIIEPIEETED